MDGRCKCISELLLGCSYPGRRAEHTTTVFIRCGACKSMLRKLPRIYRDMHMQGVHEKTSIELLLLRFCCGATGLQI